MLYLLSDLSGKTDLLGRPESSSSVRRVIIMGEHDRLDGPPWYKAPEAYQGSARLRWFFGFGLATGLVLGVLGIVASVIWTLVS